jgi:hypothetical protein
MDTVENRAMSCTFCGAGPYQGRESSYNTREEQIVECQWVCPNCGNVFASGVISRTPLKTQDEK